MAVEETTVAGLDPITERKVRFFGVLPARQKLKVSKLVNAIDDFLNPGFRQPLCLQGFSSAQGPRNDVIDVIERAAPVVFVVKDGKRQEAGALRVATFEQGVEIVVIKAEDAASTLEQPVAEFRVGEVA